MQDSRALALGPTCISSHKDGTCTSPFGKTDLYVCSVDEARPSSLQRSQLGDRTAEVPTAEPRPRRAVQPLRPKEGLKILWTLNTVLDPGPRSKPERVETFQRMCPSIPQHGTLTFRGAGILKKEEAIVWVPCQRGQDGAFSP